MAYLHKQLPELFFQTQSDYKNFIGFGSTLCLMFLALKQKTE